MLPKIRKALFRFLSPFVVTPKSFYQKNQPVEKASLKSVLNPSFSQEKALKSDTHLTKSHHLEYEAIQKTHKNQDTSGSLIDKKVS